MALGLIKAYKVFVGLMAQSFSVFSGYLNIVEKNIGGKCRFFDDISMR
jgi:hypothetical protein